MDRTYLILKSLHILGVVIFLGNIIVTGWRKIMADRAEKPQPHRFRATPDYSYRLRIHGRGCGLIPVTGIGNTIIHSLPADPSR